MGNKLNSNVSDAVKQQAAGGAGQNTIYQFTDVKGGGELVELMKKASKIKNYDEVDERIREGLKPYLYNDGRGEFIPIADIVQVRSGGKKPDMDKKKNLDVSSLEAMTDDDSDFTRKNGCQFKEVCWKLDQRGSVGETPLHVCLLNATAIHADLAKRLLSIYPKMVGDIYIIDEFYGESALHMAIVNEDPAMVKFLLDKGADYHQRCCGNFFIPDDQKASRSNSFEHEWFELTTNSNYDGYTYWGEYPLGFAVCLGQEECVRLLIARGADPNLQDTNGNTALHMIIIHDKKMRERCETAKSYCGPEDMFDMLVSLGGRLNIKNKQGLTPLTLAAKLGTKEMYDHIMQVDREVYWVFGNVECAGYPLEHIDSISETGAINTNSVLYLIVYGNKPDHLEMINGTVAQLLHEKWKTFAKYRFFRRFFFFIIYFIIAMVAFALRPGTVTASKTPAVTSDEGANGTEHTNDTSSESVEYISRCYLLSSETTEERVRLSFELLTLIGSVIYIVFALRELFHQGYQRYTEALVGGICILLINFKIGVAPAKTLFLISNIIVVLMVPGVAACASRYTDVMAVFALLSTGPYFLFFCRGFKIVGEFVVMIYQMLRTDLLRFFSIYLIFLIGFSQAMYVMFRGYDSSVYGTIIESFMGMFRMSIGAFADVYDKFSTNVTDQLKEENPTEYYAHVYTLQIIFIIYMILVTLLLVNMLIAMMGHTYDSVNESQREWHRQWAKIILVVEQTVTTDERRKQQINYSQPMKDGRRALAIRWHLSEAEQEKLEIIRQEQRTQQSLDGANA